MAAQCCKLTEIMISQCDNLWTVPKRMIEQAQSMHNQRKRNARRQKNSMEQSTNERGRSSGSSLSASHVYKIVV